MISSIDQKLIFEMLWWMIIFARRFFTIATCLKNKLKSWREDWINKNSIFMRIDGNFCYICKQKMLKGSEKSCNMEENISFTTENIQESSNIKKYKRDSSSEMKWMKKKGENERFSLFLNLFYMWGFSSWIQQHHTDSNKMLPSPSNSSKSSTPHSTFLFLHLKC